MSYGVLTQNFANQTSTNSSSSFLSDHVYSSDSDVPLYLTLPSRMTP
jgi:hypothetical protein